MTGYLFLQQFKQDWNANCHDKKFRVNISDPCSVLSYLSEVEPWCPRLPWRRDNIKRPALLLLLLLQASLQTNITGLNKLLDDDSFAWIRMRAQSSWSEWVEAVRGLERKENLQERKRQRIVLFLGALAYNPHLSKDAFKGGPLGEFVQWTDVICSLYVLGHDLVISSNAKDISDGRILTKHKNGCAVEKVIAVDRIITDISGEILMEYHFGPTLQKYRCKLLLLDSFGTEAEFNYHEYKEPIRRSRWGSRNLLLRQFMTMYPHSPDNLFMGFAIPTKYKSLKFNQIKKMQGLIYAKVPEYLKGKRKYLDVLHKYIELHGTISGSDAVINKYVPEYVINHGIVNGSEWVEILRETKCVFVNGSEWVEILRETKVFIGLGFPYEGPAPLDAIANGCFYINPKVFPPQNRDNNKFFRVKPTNRKIKSQNPYTEDFIGKPYVYTIDINNDNEVENTIREILASKDTPYLPYQFTLEGMLQRVNYFMENLDFCTPGHQWPPKSQMKISKGHKGESCKDVCFNKGLICEPSFFHLLNSVRQLTRFGFKCKAYKEQESIYAPSFNSTDQTCILQDMPLLYSCVSRDEHVTRVCPCRTYQKEQVALYKN
ncbi:hypothetical protein QZH41_019078 [Actinostola sp. cb2023]|nr:hypothetical protein QZH41_019078 [Actinostola sp. cb2023]